jgi:hypothetical protein
LGLPFGPHLRLVFGFAGILTLCAVPCANAGSQALHKIDFKNLSYVWQEPDTWPDHLEWLGASGREVHLVNGRWSRGDEGPLFAGLTLESVEYGDLTGDQKDEAVVVLRYDSGGTQYHYYVYVFTAESGRVKLLACFRSGDRSASGLYQVAIEEGTLVVELYDPEGQQGSCCSTRIRRTRYKWTKHRFDVSGRVESGTPETTSRRPVNVFGLPR